MLKSYSSCSSFKNKIGIHNRQLNKKNGYSWKWVDHVSTPLVVYFWLRTTIVITTIKISLKFLNMKKKRDNENIVNDHDI